MDNVLDINTSINIGLFIKNLSIDLSVFIAITTY